MQLDQIASGFELPDQNNKKHSLSDYHGKWLLLYFYPEDDTPGCTAEACGIRDLWSEFQKSGLSVLGVSADGVASHKNFSEKYHFTFPILADPKREVINAYGAWGEKKFGGKTYAGILRKSFLIDGQGRIRKIYDKFDPKNHAQEVFSDYRFFKTLGQSNKQV